MNGKVELPVTVSHAKVLFTDILIFLELAMGNIIPGPSSVHYCMLVEALNGFILNCDLLRCASDCDTQ